MGRKRITEMSKGVGKPKVGGPLTGLVDQRGKPRDENEFLGKYRLVGGIHTGGDLEPSFCVGLADEADGMDV
jgi:hypothetical protein